MNNEFDFQLGNMEYNCTEVISKFQDDKEEIFDNAFADLQRYMSYDEQISKVSYECIELIKRMVNDVKEQLFEENDEYISRVRHTQKYIGDIYYNETISSKNKYEEIGGQYREILGFCDEKLCGRYNEIYSGIQKYLTFVFETMYSFNRDAACRYRRKLDNIFEEAIQKLTKVNINEVESIVMEIKESALKISDIVKNSILSQHEMPESESILFDNNAVALDEQNQNSSGRTPGKCILSADILD